MFQGMITIQYAPLFVSNVAILIERFYKKTFLNLKRKILKEKYRHWNKQLVDY